jgi:hypothetical protein
MVTITSTGLSVETAKDAAGETATDGLTYDDVTNELDVDVGSGIEIDPNGKVAIPTGTTEGTALAYDFVGVR